MPRRRLDRSIRLVGARGERSAITVIHFVLPAGACSSFHRVASDEVWVHSAGGDLELHVVSPAGTHTPMLLGRGDHAIVPAGHWQAARPAGPRYVQVTCVVSPGFEFADFELARRAELESLLPTLAPELLRLARP